LQFQSDAKFLRTTYLLTYKSKQSNDRPVSLPSVSSFRYRRCFLAVASRHAWSISSLSFWTSSVRLGSIPCSSSYSRHSHIIITRVCSRWETARYGAVLAVEYERATTRQQQVLPSCESFRLDDATWWACFGGGGFFANNAISRRDLDLWPWNWSMGCSCPGDPSYQVWYS